jgi:hypothetical protein
MKGLTVAAALAGTAMVLMNHTRGQLIHASWALHLAWPLAAMAAVGIAAARRGKPVIFDTDADARPALILFLAMVVYLLSSATADRHFFLAGWAPASLFDFRQGLPRSAILTAMLTPLCLYTGRRRWLLPLGLLLSIELFTLQELARSTDWSALYRDDHPSFMYRFWSYARSFPRVIYYDPLWNGGKVGSYLIGSGIPPMGTFFLPLWRFFPILSIYTPLLGFIFIVLLPWVAVGSARLTGAGRQAALSAGILSLGLCWYFFLYLLKFGTVGSLFNTIFLLPVCAVLYRAIRLDKREVWAGVILVISSVSFLSWGGSVFLAPLIVAGVLLGMGKWTKDKVLFLSTCTFLILLILGPMYLQLHLHTDLGKFVTADNPSSWKELSFLGGWKRLGSHLRQANPLLVFLGLPGLFFTRRRGMALLLAPLFVGALVLSAWGKEWLPILQLDRMAIPLFVAACLPAAMLCGRILETRGRRWAPARAALLVLLAMGGVAGTGYYRHFAGQASATISPVMLEVAAWLKSNTDGDSRILFAGQTVHGYGSGHVALLPALTGREMMASDYYAFSPKLVEYEYPPREWRKDGAAGIREFMDLFNVGYVLTYHDRWKEKFRQDGESYEELASFMQKTLEITVFRVKRARSFFAVGSGTVSAGINRIEVRPDHPGEIVLKYRWEEGLSAGGKTELYPVDMGRGVRFIGARSGEAESFTIRYDRWL